MRAIGRIVALTKVVIPNKALGKPDRVESRFALEMESVVDARGRRIGPESFGKNHFHADGDWSGRLRVGERIAFSFHRDTGGRMQDITRLDDR